MINGKEFSYYGLIPIQNYGFLDMPSRIGELFYDWGDYIEPLVHEEDLFWSQRNLRVDFLYDSRITNLSFRQVIEELASLNDGFELVNQFGTFEVKFKGAQKTKHPNDSFVVYQFSFIEEYPLFTSNAITPISGNDISIDDHDLFKNFGAIVQSITLNDDVAELKQSSKTTITPNNLLSSFRTFKTINIKISILRDGNEIEKINNLKQILSGSDYRNIGYKGLIYITFLTSGFEVNIKRSVLQFSITLNILSQIGVFQEDLIESGLFTLGNQRKYIESIFEYPLFKTGIFQQ